MPYLPCSLLSFPFPFVFFFLVSLLLRPIKSPRPRKKGISRAPNICQIGVIFFIIPKPSKLPPPLVRILISQGKHSCQNRTSSFTCLHIHGPTCISAFSPITMDKLSLLLNPKCTWAIPFLPAPVLVTLANFLDLPLWFSFNFCQVRKVL